MKPEAWKITGSRTWCDKVVEIEDRADRSIQERDDGSFKVPLYAIHAGHVVVSEDLLRRIERECRRESDWNCENVPAGTKAATTRAKKMLEIANDLRALLGEQEEGNDVSNHQ